MKKIYAVLLLILLLTLTSCSKIELYQNLSEEDANEILVLLSENNIKATKKKEVRQNDVFYSIAVPDDQMIAARRLLVEHNMPRRKELGLTGVYKDKGLIPTPDEQKARFLLALKGEIINSLERIPQIVDADVVLNVPIKDEFADADLKHRQRPTASVIIKAKHPLNDMAPITESKIQQFVANSVEGMNPRDVTVMISYMDAAPGQGEKISSNINQLQSIPQDTYQVKQQLPPPIFSDELIGLKLDEESKDRLKVYLLIFFLLLILLSSALIVVIVQGSRMRRKMSEANIAPHPAIEGQVLSESPPQLPLGQQEESDEL